MADKPAYTVGKGRPPKRTQWGPGESGNRKGRPRKVRSELPHEDVLGQVIQVTINGRKQEMTGEAVFMHDTINRASAGDTVMARALAAMEKDSRRFRRSTKPPLKVVCRVYSEPGDVNHAARALGMARLLDGFRSSAYMAIEPHMVQAAIDRLGDRRLTLSQQETVFAATRMPHKVRWPDWWTVTDFPSSRETP